MKGLIPVFTSETDVAASFWPLTQRLHPHTDRSQSSLCAATNLYELFEQNLSLLVAGACRVDVAARTAFAALAPDQIALRRLVLGLAESARGCLPALPPALFQEGLVLLPVRDVVVNVLLLPVTSARSGARINEPLSVTGARLVDAFTHVALHFEAEASHAADDAGLLGSDRLQQALSNWAARWRDCLHDLRRCAKTIRIQVYAAEFEAPPRWQTA